MLTNWITQVWQRKLSNWNVSNADKIVAELREFSYPED